jgi:acyl carrier protein
MQPEDLTVEAIRGWLVGHLAELLKIAPHEIDVRTHFDRYGLDSAEVVTLTGDLEDWLGRQLSPSLLYDYLTIEDLAQHLAEDAKVAE